MDNLLKINSRNISLEVSMYVDEITEKFVQGIFLNQELRLSSDGWNVGIFKVTSVDVGNRPNFDAPIRFRAQSPICISRPQQCANGKLIPKYLSPTELDYDDYFFENLRNTYRSTHPELLKCGYDAGFGEKTASGFGCCQALRPRMPLKTENQ